MLKSTGIVRKVDELGRVVIPIELRRNLSIAKRMPWKSMWMRTKSFLKSTSLPVYLWQCRWGRNLSR